jgi:hypothetical protein
MSLTVAFHHSAKPQRNDHKGAVLVSRRDGHGRSGAPRRVVCGAQSGAEAGAVAAVRAGRPRPATRSGFTNRVVCLPPQARDSSEDAPFGAKPRTALALSRVFLLASS